MVAIALGTTMAVLDGQIANVALPTIARELHADPARVVWVVNAFQIAITVMLLPFAAVGDAVGYRRVWATGIAIFTLGSLFCALSQTLGLLIASRIVQGFGAAAIMSVGPALYRTVFPNAMLGRALGISALVVASSSAAGPTLGGAILALAPWPWLFAVNVPLGIVDAVLARRVLPATSGTGRRFDAPSAVLSTLALGSLVLALDGFAHGGARVQSVAFFALSAATAFAFVARQRRVPNPLLPLDIFSSERFSLAAATSLCSFLAQGLAFVSLPFLFQNVYGYAPLVSGLLFTPWPIAIALMAPVAGRLADRYNPQILATAGLGVLSLGLALLALLPAHATALDIVWRNVVCGLGFGFFQSPNNRELLGSVPRERSGTASGVLASMRVLGQTLGAAFVAIALGTAAAATLDPHAAAAIAPSVHATLAAASAAAACAALVSGSRLRPVRPRPVSASA